jgi:hypothetical protein
VTKARMLAQCHELIFGELRAASFTGFECQCADGSTRRVFPAIHSYVADTPEHHKVAAVMGWPAACYCCAMPRNNDGGQRTLADIVTAGRWPLRTPREAEQLQQEADAVARSAAAAERAAAAAARRAPDPTAALRAAAKFCEARGIRWCGTRNVLWCALAASAGNDSCACCAIQGLRAPAFVLPLQRRAHARSAFKANMAVFQAHALRGRGAVRMCASTGCLVTCVCASGTQGLAAERRSARQPVPRPAC